ncbi:MAG: nucleotidyltransferase [Anaerocolumna sp.]
MKIVGLITEYNPFHNGHLYHIKEAKKMTGADYVIVVMSGNFVQRGAPALIDKYNRTEMALACGADIVLELPVSFSTASAELFALGAVSLLDKLGIVDYLCFGSECGNTTLLENAASILLKEPKEYKEVLNHLLKKGNTFPAARMEALKAISPLIGDSLLSFPNNILGIEYLKALLRLNSPIKPVTITRLTAEYSSLDLTPCTEKTISSATAIRKALFHEKSLTNFENHVPRSVYKLMQENYQKTFPICDGDFSLLLNYKLMQETKATLTKYSDITPDLANRIHDTNTQGLNFKELAGKIKTRQWTLTRINRVLIHLLLNLYSDNFNEYKESGYAQYARLLGFKKTSSHLIREILKNENIPVITKMADAKEQLSSIGLTMLKEDIFAAHLYNQVAYNKYGTVLKDEYTRGVIIF